MTSSVFAVRSPGSLGTLVGRTVLRLGLVLWPLLGSVACGDLTGAALPAGMQSPETYNTEAGALAMYRGTKSELPRVIRDVIIQSGALTDELAFAGLGSGPTSIGATGDLVDERMLNETLTYTNELQGLTPATIAVRSIWGSLNRVRGNATQAIGLLTAYAPSLSSALRGEMYALQGYAETMLAELFCSGVPLSTLDFEGDFTYKPGSTTDEVYAHAAALFDSALVMSSDSVRTVWLASIGKARVLLGQGQYAQAAELVATVPVTFQYRFSRVDAADTLSGTWNVGTREGGNGVPFYTVSGTLITSNDPRSWVAPTSPAANTFGVRQLKPVKPALESMVLASGVEARLIEAEAALHAGDPSWLTILNTLRTDGTMTFPYTRTCLNGRRVGSTTTQQGSPCPAGYADTVWGPGTGIGLIPAAVLADNRPVCPTGTGLGVPCTDTVWYRGLRPLSDPGTDAERVDMLFAERAYWLFLTGHRQGDLRRLVRNYGRPQEIVYPTGPYFGGFGSYGTDVNLPIPAEERINPLFQGCLHRGA